MMAARKWLFAVAAGLMTAGCSTTGGAPLTSAPAPPSTTPPTTAAAASVFCRELTPFRVIVVVFRGGVVDAVRGRPLDIKDLRERAAYIASTGKAMQPSAPPDIAEELRVVRKAVRTAASRLKPGAKVRDILNPLYGEHVDPAFEALDNYKCR
ncbi:hypothetical protein [Nonomuraea sp. B19D2]|uniref:hypothetical protein n=1 Tax=Nonomuraea sp. B19D2 TaxID=3159561 RepID=UPI0032DB5968